MAKRDKQRSSEERRRALAEKRSAGPLFTPTNAAARAAGYPFSDWSPEIALSHVSDYELDRRIDAMTVALDALRVPEAVKAVFDEREILLEHRLQRDFQKFLDRFYADDPAARRRLTRAFHAGGRNRRPDRGVDQ